VLAIIASVFAALGARPADALDVDPPGLTAFGLTAGSLQVNTGLSNEQNFDLTPSDTPACSDGVDNNDAPPINTGHDGLTDFPADPECSSAADNSELAPGFQPLERVVVVANVAANGTFTIPKNVRASESEARSLGGIYFPPGYIPDSTLGMITARFQPAPGSNVNTPATGTINVETGAVSISMPVRIKLEGGSGLTALGSGCYIPSGNNGISLGFTTGTTAPPAPNTPISGSPYSRTSGDYSVVDNSFAVGTAGTCGPLGLANSSINSAFGLPAAAGRNAARFTFHAQPILNRIDAPAVADAGEDQIVHTGSTVTIDGSGTHDPNHDPFTFSWTQTDGPAVTLTGADTLHPTFPAGAGPQTYKFEITADDGSGPSTDSVTIDVLPNIDPVADAGGDHSAPTGAQFLDGTGSSDADGHTLTYSWVQTDGPEVELSGADTATPTFTATGPTVLTFDLTVTDGWGGSDTDTVVVTVTGNNDPVANAGPDQTGKSVGSTITLDGSASSDPDGGGQTLTYHWTQTGGTAVTLSNDTAIKPTFTAPATGPDTLTFDLTVSDNFGGSNTDSVSIEVIANQDPVANHGPNQTNKKTGNTITLDGSASSDPDGHSLQYTWTQTSGVPVTLNDEHAQKPTFVVPPAPDFVYPHSIGFSLTVTDGFGGSNTTADSVSIQVTATTPTVSTPTRSPSGTVFVGQTVTFSTNVVNPDGGTLSFLWTRTQPTSGTTFPATNTTSSASASVVMPDTTVTTSTGPRYNVKVTHTSTTLASSTSSSSAAFSSSLYTRPVANAGPNQNVKEGATVTLTALGSTQAQGNPLTYQWTQTGGPTVTLSDATAAQPTFTAPSTTGALTFTVIATDTVNPTAGNGTGGKVSPVSAPVTINVSQYAAPIADAGPDQSNVDPDLTVTLDGSGSSQADGHALTYTWTQTAGPTVTLSDNHAVKPTFTSPQGPATVTFSLIVNDDFHSSTPDEVSVSLNDFDIPVADAGPDQSAIDPDQLVQLDGSNSFQSDGHDLTYEWTQTAGIPVTLSDSNAAQPTFTAPTGPTTIRFSLVVSDAYHSSLPDEVAIGVNGIAGLDLKGVLTGEIKGNQASSAFKLNVSNVGTKTRTLTGSDVSLSAMLNSEVVPAEQFVVTDKTVTLKPGQSATFSLSWQHGNQAISAGDLIDVAGCVNVLGDSVPENDCEHVQSPSSPVDYSAVATIGAVKKSAVSNTVTLTATNNGLSKIGPLRSSQMSVTVLVDDVPVGDITPPAQNTVPAPLAPGASSNNTFKWTHPKLTVGSVVHINACVNIPGNTSTSSCSVVETTVVS
jgi:hypothetical protein